MNIGKAINRSVVKAICLVLSTLLVISVSFNAYFGYQYSKVKAENLYNEYLISIIESVNSLEASEPIDCAKNDRTITEILNKFHFLPESAQELGGTNFLSYINTFKKKNSELMQSPEQSEREVIIGLLEFYKLMLISDISNGARV